MNNRFRSIKAYAIISAFAGTLVATAAAMAADSGAEQPKLAITKIRRTKTHEVEIVVRVTNVNDKPMLVSNGSTSLYWSYKNCAGFGSDGNNPDSIALNSYCLLQPAGKRGDSASIGFTVPEKPFEVIIKGSECEDKGKMSLGWEMEYLVFDAAKNRFDGPKEDVEVEYSIPEKLELPAD